MRCFLLGFAGFCVAAIAAFLALASYGDYAARASVSETLAAAAPLRGRIAEQILQQRAGTSPGAPLAPLKDAPAVAGTDYLKVGADGTVVLRSSRHGQILVLEPAVRDNAVTWRCIGSKPEKNLPPSCR